MVTRRQQAQLRAAARDRYLRFGLAGVPDRYTEPITSQLEGRRFQDLPGADAALVLEGLTFLHCAKSGVVGLIALPFAILANQLPPTATTIGLAIIFSIMFVLPPYMRLSASYTKYFAVEPDDRMLLSAVTRGSWWRFGLLRTLRWSSPSPPVSLAPRSSRAWAETAKRAGRELIHGCRCRR